jgi:ABC-2 type transport system permease protein
VLGAARDVGGGLVPPRPGPRTASPRLATPLALAARLHRGSLAGWSAGALVTAVAYGSIADSVEEFIADNEQLAEMLARLQGVNLVDSYLATSFRVLALIGAGFAIGAALRARSEESAGLAEPLLATPVSRNRFAASHLTMALAGAFVVLATSGLGVGLSVAAVRGDPDVVPELLLGSLIYLPAVAVLVGVASILVGVAPRVSGAAWAALVACFVISLLGDLLKLPDWAQKSSPFEHVPEVPAHDLTVVPLLVLTAVAAGCIAVGLTGFRRRGIG